MEAGLFEPADWTARWAAPTADAGYDAPTFYFTNPHALYGPGEAVPRPRLSRALDFELEVACVLGAGGSNLTEDGFLDVDCQVTVNGELVGHDRLSRMRWTFPQMVAYAARDSRVVAGDLLASGTTGGGGCLAELWGRRGERTPLPLEPGDEVSLTVEALGVLTSSVAEIS